QTSRSAPRLRAGNPIPAPSVAPTLAPLRAAARATPNALESCGNSSLVHEKFSFHRLLVSGRTGDAGFAWEVHTISRDANFRAATLLATVCVLATLFVFPQNLFDSTLRER